MAEANAPAVCPDGHAGAVRLLSAFASVGTISGSGASTSGSARPPAQPCGAHCACHPG
jgi:hypothetical protein